MVTSRTTGKRLPHGRQVTKAAKGRQRRGYSQIFLDALKKLSGADQSMVPNRQLRDDLGWDEERYARIRSELRREGQVVLGRGQGGSVGLTRPDAKDALRVFVSYSHADEKLKESVIRHLRPLENFNLISHWHDRKLLAGEEWKRTIDKELENADIVLLLLSIDFLNSGYCYDIEMSRAIERHELGQCRVIPVILRGCLWNIIDSLSRLQALPRDAKPVTTWPDQDECLATVAASVRLVAEDLLASR